LLLFPQTVTTGAANGLTLWFYNVIPALFPAMLLTQLSMRFWGRNLERPLPFIIFTGLLCGYPIGAMSLLLADKKDSILMPYINVTSPAFILNYVLMMGLSGSNKIPLLLSIYIPILLCITFIIITSRQKLDISGNVTLARAGSSTLEIVETSINTTLENILKLGAYIILSAIICQFIIGLPLDINIKSVICGFIEITTGIYYLSMTAFSPGIKLILVCVFCAFGGFSCLCQTYTVVGSGFKAKKYICHKLVLTAVTAVVSLSVAYVSKIL
ncbi:MAG: hypothetical protein ACI4EV_00730, partial [Lachnospiraceae bacterium]